MEVRRQLACVLAAASVLPAFAAGDGVNCQGLPTKAQLKEHMIATAGPGIGGLFNGARMWAAVVNRDGQICAYATSTQDPAQVWPGSQAIAKAKAYTANAFSLDSLALSTARLYTFTQPGHSLWSLGQSNLFNASLLAPPSGTAGGANQIAGGRRHLFLSRWRQRLYPSALSEHEEERSCYRRRSPGGRLLSKLRVLARQTPAGHGKALVTVRIFTPTWT